MGNVRFLNKQKIIVRNHPPSIERDLFEYMSTPRIVILYINLPYYCHMCVIPMLNYYYIYGLYGLFVYDEHIQLVNEW